MKNFIKNIDELSVVFQSDKIPSFHDSEIVSILLSRESNVFIEAVVLVYRTMEEHKTGAKTFRRRKNAYCSFRFDSVKLESLNSFYHQNVIDDLEISREEESEMLNVHFRAIVGCDLKFQCRQIELMRVRVSESVKESNDPR